MGSVIWLPLCGYYHHLHCRYESESKSSPYANAGRRNQSSELLRTGNGDETAVLHASWTVKGPGTCTVGETAALESCVDALCTVSDVIVKQFPLRNPTDS